MLSQVFLEKRVGKIPKLVEAISLHVLFATICYFILIFILGSLAIPVFIDDFNRSIIFLTAILVVIYYKEDLREILLLCFGGPFVTNIIALIPTILIWSKTPSEQVGTDIMRLFTFSTFYIVYAGFVGVAIYTIAVWISGFMTSESPDHSSILKKNVFSVIDKKSEINNSIDMNKTSGDTPHTKIQVISFLIFVLILLNLAILLFLLPFYSYSFDLYLTIWDLGLFPVLLIGVVIIDLISIILVTVIWNLHPRSMERYPSSIVGIQSKLAAISIFFSSIFFPNPSSIRVGSFVVENSIGIEILFYTILLIIVFTPSICEYLQPIRALSYQSKVKS
ncbi:MAG: hypothetical protein ACFFDC_17925 [Promethearchaeota archaeon]